MSGAQLAAFAAGACLVWALSAVSAAARPRRPDPGRGSLTALAGRLGRLVGAPRAPVGLAARMAAAGLPPTARAADLMAVKAGLAAGGIATAVAAGGGDLRTTLTLVLLLGGAGFAGPDLRLARRARARQAQAELELPAVIELIRIAIEAGLPVRRALAEVAARGRGVVAAELRAVCACTALGAPHDDGLGRLMLRLPLPEVAMLVAALRRCERHGAPAGPALAALVTDARARRAVALQERAAAAAPRIQLAIALLLVPAVLLLIAAAVVHAVA